MMNLHVKHRGIARTIYTQIIHSDAHEADAVLDTIEFSKPAHVEIGAAVIVSCKVRSSIRRATAEEPNRLRYAILYWYL